VWLTGPKEKKGSWRDFEKLFIEAANLKRSIYPPSDDLLRRTSYLEVIGQLGVFVTAPGFFQNLNEDKIEESLITLSKENPRWIIVTGSEMGTKHLQISCSYGFCARHTKYSKNTEQERKKESLRCPYVDPSYERPIQFMQPSTHFYYLNPKMWNNLVGNWLLVGTDTGDETKNQIAKFQWAEMAKSDYFTLTESPADIWIHSGATGLMHEGSSFVNPALDHHMMSNGIDVSIPYLIRHGGMVISYDSLNRGGLFVQRACHFRSAPLNIPQMELRNLPIFSSEGDNLYYYYQPFPLYDTTYCSYP